MCEIHFYLFINGTTFTNGSINTNEIENKIKKKNMTKKKLNCWIVEITETHTQRYSAVYMWREHTKV